MSIETGPEQYIEKIRDLGLNQFPNRYRDEMVKSFGADRINLDKIVSEENFERARDYLTSPAKQLFEQVFGGIAWLTVGKPASWLMTQAIERIDGPNGRYYLRVGLSDTHTHEEVKIRTYANGEDQKNGHFEGANYALNGGKLHGKLIDHKLPRILRKTGLDEFPQLRAVWLARMSLVGLRGYTDIERQDLEIMYQLVDNPDLGNTDEVKEIVKNHHHFVRRQHLKPAIVHPRACLKMSTAISRLYGDLMYTFLASPQLDWTIFVNAMVNREKTAIRNGIKN